MSANHTEYTRVAGDEQDDASTVVDESTTGRQPGEKSCVWHQYSHAPQPRRSGWRLGCSSMLLQGLVNTIMLLVVLALLLDRRWHQERGQVLEGNGDITGFIPPVSQQIMSFVPDMSFAPENGSDFFSPAVKKKWLSIVPSMPTSFPLRRLVQC